MFCGPEGSKGRLAKAAGAKPWLEVGWKIFQLHVGRAHPWYRAACRFPHIPMSGKWALGLLYPRFLASSLRPRGESLDVSEWASDNLLPRIMASAGNSQVYLICIHLCGGKMWEGFWGKGLSMKTMQQWDLRQVLIALLGKEHFFNTLLGYAWGPAISPAWIEVHAQCYGKV